MMKNALILICAMWASHAAAAVQSAPVPDDGRSWLKWDEVPPGVLKRGERRRTNMVVAVSPEGRVIDCTLTLSSGDAAIDQLACAPFLKHGRFRAARDERGQPTSGIFSFGRTWEALDTAIDAASSRARSPRPVPGFGDWVTPDDLPRGAMRPEEVVVSDLVIFVSAQGKVQDCGISTPSERPDLDLYACRLITARGRYIPALDSSGQPTGAPDWQRVRWQVPLYR